MRSLAMIQFQSWVVSMQTVYLKALSQVTAWFLVVAEKVSFWTVCTSRRW